MAQAFLRCALSALAALALVGCGQQHAAYQPGPLSKAEEWPANGRDNGQTLYSPLEDTSAETVGRLGFAWEFKDFSVRGRTRHPAPAFRH